MSKKTVYIILISLAVIILLAVVLISVKKPSSQNVPADAQQNTGQQNNASPLAKGDKGGFLEEQAVEVTVKETDPKILEEESIKSFAKTFFERYGSFSSDSNYENFSSLRSLMTDKANKEMESYIEKLRNLEIKKLGNGRTEEFYGVTTKVLSVKVEQMMDLSAKVNISYQKQEKRGDKDIAVSYGKAEMELVKEEGVWEVEGVDSEL